MTLTDEEIKDVWCNSGSIWQENYVAVYRFARAIIAAHDDRLRKQEPLGEIVLSGTGVTSAPDKKIKVLDYLRVRAMPLGAKVYAAPIPTPTPSQQEARIAELKAALDKAAMHVRPTCGGLYEEIIEVLARPEGEKK